MMVLKKTVVIDNGTGSCKVGFAGDTEPALVVPTVAEQQSARQSLIGPIEKGFITNWDDMEKLWHQIFFKELNLTPSEHPVLLTQAPNNSKDNRERMAQIMFETFNVPSLFLAIQPVLALYATGHINGVVLESGAGVTHVVPVKEGYAITSAMSRLEFGGNVITDHLRKILSSSGKDFAASATQGTINDIKEKLGFIALNYEKELAGLGPPVEKSYNLPDGQTITIGNERFQATEALFQPSLIGSGSPGVHALIQESIAKCDADFQKQLYGNVVLSGGNTLFPGLEKRLHNELRPLAGEGTQININAPKTRLNAVFTGASTLAALEQFKTLLVSKEEYEEHGNSILDKKFPN